MYIKNIEDNVLKIKNKFFFKKTSNILYKGIMISILAGMCYGIYSAFISIAMNKGIWSEWKVSGVEISKFAAIYITGVLGTALNDTVSAVWAWFFIIKNGKAEIFFQNIRKKEGKILILAAIIGGPLAGAAYVIALQISGSIIIPIATLTPATGAILGKIILKQQLNARKIVGVIICAFAGILIGMNNINGNIAGNNVILGMILAFIAALGWGLEGVIAGYSTTFIDYEIGITIRQTISGLFSFLVLLPFLSIINGNLIMTVNMTISALKDISSFIFFILSGFFALFAFSLWYKGNSICGAALGMACNASAFWGPFFCWLIIGVIMGEKGWEVAPVVWLGAFIMIAGIILIALNPLEFISRKKNESSMDSDKEGGSMLN